MDNCLNFNEEICVECALIELNREMKFSGGTTGKIATSSTYAPMIIASDIRVSQKSYRVE
jgi:superfamily II helicase